MVGADEWTEGIYPRTANRTLFLQRRHLGLFLTSDYRKPHHDAQDMISKNWHQVTKVSKALLSLLQCLLVRTWRSSWMSIMLKSSAARWTLHLCLTVKLWSDRPSMENKWKQYAFFILFPLLNCFMRKAANTSLVFIASGVLSTNVSLWERGCLGCLGGVPTCIVVGWNCTFILEGR